MRFADAIEPFRFSAFSRRAVGMTRLKMLRL
jgi:hypothetical protein